MVPNNLGVTAGQTVTFRNPGGRRSRSSRTRRRTARRSSSRVCSTPMHRARRTSTRSTGRRVLVQRLYRSASDRPHQRAGRGGDLTGALKIVPQRAEPEVADGGVHRRDGSVHRGADGARRLHARHPLYRNVRSGARAERPVRSRSQSTSSDGKHWWRPSTRPTSTTTWMPAPRSRSTVSGLFQECRGAEATGRRRTSV